MHITLKTFGHSSSFVICSYPLQPVQRLEAPFQQHLSTKDRVLLLFSGPLQLPPRSMHRCGPSLVDTGLSRCLKLKKIHF